VKHPRRRMSLESPISASVEIRKNEKKTEMPGGRKKGNGEAARFRGYLELTATPHRGTRFKVLKKREFVWGKKGGASGGRCPRGTSYVKKHCFFPRTPGFQMNFRGGRLKLSKKRRKTRGEPSQMDEWSRN